MKDIWFGLQKWETWIALLLIFGFIAVSLLTGKVTTENENSTQCIIQYQLLTDFEERRVIESLDSRSDSTSVSEFCNAIDEIVTK